MSLTNTTIKNLSFLGTIKVLSKGLNAITLIVLARLLLPSDFGIVAIAGLFFSILDQFSDIGISGAIIHRKEKVEESLNTGFSLRMIISIFLFIIAFIVAPFWSKLYEIPEITLIVRIFALVFIVNSLNFIPETKLKKELRFDLLVIPELLGRLVYSGVTIFLAYSGFSFWSLVYGQIARSIVILLAMRFVCPWKIQLSFNKELANELLNFGKYILVFVVLIFSLTNIDNAVIGKIMGMTALGYYLIAYRWANYSTEISNSISTVMFPTYSTINDDITRIRGAYLKTLKYTSMMSMPITVGIIAIAPEFVTIILGEKWAPAILPLQILCIFGASESISSTASSVFFSTGKPKIPAFLYAIKLIVMIIFILPVTKMYGIIGVSMLVSVLNIVLFPITFGIVGKYFNITVKHFCEVLLPSVFSAILMSIGIFIVKDYVGKNFQFILNFPLLNFSFLVLFGAILYILLSFILTKGKFKEDLKILTDNLKFR